MKGMIGTMLAMAHIMGNTHDMYDPTSNRGTNPLRPEDIKLNTKQILPKGCKVYNIEGVDIVAISEKSAIKKYNKKFGKTK